MKRIDKLYDMKLHDPYMDKSQYKDPTICPSCKLIYHNKRWFWDEKYYEELMKEKDKVSFKKCPACRKIEDHYPLGIVELEGEYVKKNKGEILNLIKNEAEYEKKRNPLARIMNIKETEDGLVIETTTETLAKKIGKAVHKAHQGELDLSFSDTQKLLRVYWSRE